MAMQNQPGMRILVIEDDPVIADAARRALERDGHAVDHVASAEQAKVALHAEAFDLAVLDIGLPGQDGLQLLGDLRRRGRKLPVLMLTARDGINDRVTALDMGADDYLTKPFQIPELQARCRALLRRASGVASSQLELGALSLDLVRKEVRLEGQLLDLTQREWSILECLALNMGHIVSKETTAFHGVGAGAMKSRPMPSRCMCPACAPSSGKALSSMQCAVWAIAWMKTRLDEQRPERTSIRRRLLRLLVLPVALVLLVGTAGDVFIGVAPIREAYDLALSDAALALAQNVKVDANGRVDAHVSQESLNILQTDSSDQVYFQISLPDGTLVAGNRDLPRAPHAGGKSLPPDRGVSRPNRCDWPRIVMTRARGPLVITVAETMNKRGKVRAAAAVHGTVVRHAGTARRTWPGLDRRASRNQAAGPVSDQIARRSPSDLTPLPASRRAAGTAGTHRPAQLAAGDH